MAPRGERDPLAASRELAASLAEAVPAVPSRETALDGDARAQLARLRLGLVPAHGMLPSVAVVGRRAVGKSAFAHAAFGASSVGARCTSASVDPGWCGPVLLHDTPGLRAAGAGDVARALGASLAHDPPSLVVSLFAATEVDAGIDDDAADLRSLLRAWTPRWERPPSVVAVLHRCDELPPFDAPFGAYDPSRALHVAASLSLLRRHVGAKVDALAVTPAATPDGVLAADDRRAFERLVLRALPRDDAANLRAQAFRRVLRVGAAVDDAVASFVRRWERASSEAQALLLVPRGWPGAHRGAAEAG